MQVKTADGNEKVSVKVEVNYDDSDPDPVEEEFKVIVCQPPTDATLYRVQFPTRKVNALTTSNVAARFKKTVKMLEIKMKADTNSSSYDKEKAKHLASVYFGNNPDGPTELDEETYLGRSFRSNAPIHYAIGFFSNRVLYLCPLEGNLEMNRSISYLNNQGKHANAMETEEQAESDNDASNLTKTPIRVRYARPETERQKKRREESALHRSKIIEQDPWISLNVHNKEDSETLEKCIALKNFPSTSSLLIGKIDPEQLIQEAIIGKKMEELDLNNCNQLISLRRIRHLPESQQVRALMIKARAISTADAYNYVSPSMSYDLLILRLRECAHLVRGVWVLKSECLYRNDSQVTFRAARDLALALIESGLTIRRSELQEAFGLSFDDATSILLSFGLPQDNTKGRTWVLKVPHVDDFITCKKDLETVLEEKRYWHKRWAEIHKFLQMNNERRVRKPTGLKTNNTSTKRSAAAEESDADTKMKVIVID
uniref:DNA-directed RNA polymerase III subunit RPC5 n=1 Tax=Syphacia muris TaxID=451379 RepID=A0A158R4N0_9BILA